MSDKYEHIEVLIKAPTDGSSWFDRISDLISEECTSEDECTCGLESMGGSTGTLEQCYDSMRISEKWASDVRADDLKIALEYMNVYPETHEVYERLRKAAYWHEEFQEWLDSIPDDDEEEE